MACRDSKPKKDMLRMVVDDEGQIWPDLLQKAPGRGVYHCMSQACLACMSDKRLQPLKANFKIVLPQWEVLQQRLEAVLQQQLKQMFTRQSVTAAIGRDAVMHRLWNNAPLLVLRAADAGEALVRQIDAGLEKRAQAGLKAGLASVTSKSWLGEMFGRDDVAVAGLDAAGVNAGLVNRLNLYCVWLGRIKVSG